MPVTFMLVILMLGPLPHVHLAHPYNRDSLLSSLLLPQHLACVLFPALRRAWHDPHFHGVPHTEPARHRRASVHSLLFLLFFVANFPAIRGSRSSLHHVYHPLPLAVFCWILFLFLFSFPSDWIWIILPTWLTCRAPVLIMNYSNVEPIIFT